MNKRKGITLLALVITIVIMLLLAGVAIQMTMGENGLIAKSNQAKKEQAKAELLEDAKLGYLNLKTKAIEEKSPTPEYELLLSTSEFLDKYNIVGDNITDKQGNIIETKQEILNTLKMLYPKTDGKKTVGGVEIPESDKDKMIFKLKIKEDGKSIRWCNIENYTGPSTPIKIDYGDGTKGELTDYYWGSGKTYNKGEYIVKLENVELFSMGSLYSYQEDGYEVELLQWGKIKTTGYKNITLRNVSVIHEPEPVDTIVEYRNGQFSEIPENLFENKKDSKYVSMFRDCNNLTGIPVNLFKNCINVESFDDIFFRCANLTNIPEDLFKYNINLKNVNYTFSECSKITNIPENLFKHNINLKSARGTFKKCSKLENIPENLFKYNTNLKYMNEIFSECTELTNIPSRLISNNSQLKEVENMFAGCKKIIDIPTNIIQDGIKLKERGGIAWRMFKSCTAANNYSIIPNDLK